uniref:Uncharacterized protein n=1 Tax=Caldisericum exile TaxID=693075 RepID=A0A7C4U1F4_9BACT
MKGKMKNKTKLEPISSEKVAASSYGFMRDWEEKAEEVLITDEPEKKVFVNKKFASGSKFGDDCIFVRCTFGSGCNFGSECIKNLPYWDENGKHEKK